MELSRLIRLLKKNSRLFWAIVAIFVIVAFLFQMAQAPRFEAVQLLNVGRTGIQNTSEYTYDSFYRLQADERFADTVVRWLGSPRVAEDVYREAGLAADFAALDDLRGAFAAGRLSSQMVEVTYGAATESTLRALSEALPLVLNRYSESLNLENREENWFVIVPSDPVIRDSRLTLALLIPIALAVGMFFAFWVIVAREYWRLHQNELDDISTTDKSRIEG